MSPFIREFDNFYFISESIKQQIFEFQRAVWEYFFVPSLAIKLNLYLDSY